MLSMIDTHFPTAVHAVSVTHMERFLNKEYVYPGLSSEDLKKAEAKRKRMLNNLSAGFSELEHFLCKIKQESIPQGLLNDDLEQRLDFLVLNTAGIIAYVSSFRTNTIYQSSSLSFFNEVIDLLVKTHNIVSEIKTFVMEARADNDSSSSETFTSIDDMFRKLDS